MDEESLIEEFAPEGITAVLKALSDPKRLRIFAALLRGVSCNLPCPVGHSPTGETSSPPAANQVSCVHHTKSKTVHSIGVTWPLTTITRAATWFPRPSVFATSGTLVVTLIRNLLTFRAVGWCDPLSLPWRLS